MYSYVCSYVTILLLRAGADKPTPIPARLVPNEYQARFIFKPRLFIGHPIPWRVAAYLLLLVVITSYTYCNTHAHSRLHFPLPRTEPQYYLTETIVHASR